MNIRRSKRIIDRGETGFSRFFSLIAVILVVAVCSSCNSPLSDAFSAPPLIEEPNSESVGSDPEYGELDDPTFTFGPARPALMPG